MYTRDVEAAMPVGSSTFVPPGTIREAGPRKGGSWVPHKFIGMEREATAMGVHRYTLAENIMKRGHAR